jgi:hypothetical protein
VPDIEVNMNHQTMVSVNPQNFQKANEAKVSKKQNVYT